MAAPSSPPRPRQRQRWRAPLRRPTPQPPCAATGSTLRCRPPSSTSAVPHHSAACVSAHTLLCAQQRRVGDVCLGRVTLGARAALLLLLLCCFCCRACSGGAGSARKSVCPHCKARHWLAQGVAQRRRRWRWRPRPSAPLRCTLAAPRPPAPAGQDACSRRQRRLCQRLRFRRARARACAAALLLGGVGQGDVQARRSWRDASSRACRAAGCRSAAARQPALDPLTILL